VAVWSVYVQVEGGPLGGPALLDSLVDAVEGQEEALGASVASGAEASVFVSVEAATVGEAARKGELIASRALQAVGQARATRTTLVYDDAGSVAYQEPRTRGAS
jgi:hypothetical protein